MDKSKIVRGLAIVGLLAIAPAADARSVGVMIYSGSFPQGATFTNCATGKPIFAETSGYDSGGTRVCFFRKTENALWQIDPNDTECDAAATQAATLREHGTTVHCASPRSAWGTGQSCSANLWYKSGTGSCASHSPIFAFSSSGL